MARMSGGTVEVRGMSRASSPARASSGEAYTETTSEGDARWFPRKVATAAQEAPRLADARTDRASAGA